MVILEPAIDTRAISDLAEVLIRRIAAAEPAVRAERDLFRPLARAYFRDRERALSGAAVPRTTLMLETARIIWDHLVAEAIRHGHAWPGDPSRRLRGDARLHHVISRTLAGALPPVDAERLAGEITGLGAAA